jgi:tetratricopeptide (TPR) repeat protein
MKSGVRLFGGLVLFVLLAGGARAEEAAQVVELAGEADRREADQAPWHSVSINQWLETGDYVRTRAHSSAALVLIDRTQVRMNARAELRLLKPEADKTLLELVVGRLWSRSKARVGLLELKTPSAVAVVRGTDWDIEVDAGGNTRLAVLSGVIDISNAFGAVQVNAGEEALVELGKAPTKRALVRPQERVQWVMDSPVDPARYQEFVAPPVPDTLVSIRQAVERGELEAAYQRLLGQQQPPPHPAVQLLLADFEFADQAHEAAFKRLTTLIEQGEPRAVARLAQMQMARGRMEAAGKTLDAARKAGMDSPVVDIARGDWLRLQGLADEAAAAYTRALSPVGGFYEAAAQEGLGKVALERGNTARAVSSFQQSVRLKPEVARYQGGLATALTQSYQLVRGEERYQHALNLDPGDFVTLAGSGLLALQRGEPAQARDQLLKALVIEPDYARGQVWLAVAEYQLGLASAALDSLERAILADPRDPLPWQLKSMILVDQGQPAVAIEASREALARLPYLKSLNQLSVDSQGSANLGTALSTLGLEHWARAYAESSSYPLWAGSHFFMSERLDSEYGRTSALYKGYLANPMALGTAARRASLFERPGQELDLQASWFRTDPRDVTAASLTWRGIAAEPFHAAGFLRGQRMNFDPREAPGELSYRLEDREETLALGLKPTENIGLFGLFNRDRNQLRFTPPVDLGNGYLFDQPQRERLHRRDLGANYRWDHRGQSWILLNRGWRTVKTTLSNVQFGDQEYRHRLDDEGLALRHTQILDRGRVSFGWEREQQSVASSLGDPFFTSEQRLGLRSELLWITSQWQREPWWFYLGAFKPDLKFESRDWAEDPQTGELFFPPNTDFARPDDRVRPRVGLSYKWQPGSALHLAYIEHLQGAGNQTLAPVSVGRIPLDYQYLLPGSDLRKIAALLEKEINDRTFLSIGVQHQRIENTSDSTGYLYSRRFTPIFDVLEQVEPRSVSAGMVLDRYEVDPLFEAGTIRRLSAGANRLINDSLGLAVDYRFTETRNTGSTWQGNELPGFAEHDIAFSSTFHHRARTYSLAALRYQNGYFTDEANRHRQDAGWVLSLGHSRESKNRDWGLDLMASGALDGSTNPSVFLRGLRRW